MRGITVQFGTERALVIRVRRLHPPIEPRTHFIWLDYPGQPIGPKRDALIASGVANPTDNFVTFSWKTRPPDLQAAPPAESAADVQS